MSNESKVRNFILENYLFSEDQSELDSNDSFLNKGIIDSTGIMEVIFFLEDEFGVQVEDEDMVPENLDSINSIVRFIATKQA